MIRNADYVLSLITDPLNLARKAQVGVDLTLNKASRIESSTNKPRIIYNDKTNTSNLISSYTPIYLGVDIFNHNLNVDNMINFEPGVYSIEFDQGIELPLGNTAVIYQRSTLGRNGSMIRSSIYDPGFSTPYMGAILYCWQPISIQHHARIAQIIVFESENSEAYNGQFQNEKDFR